MADSRDCGYTCGYNRIVKKRGRKSAWQQTISPPVSAEDAGHTYPAIVRRESLQHARNGSRATVDAYVSPGATHYEASQAHKRNASASEPSHAQRRSRPSFSGSYHDRPADVDIETSPRCLAQLYPLLDGIVEPELARELLELYFVQSQGSFFDRASPYVLTPVLCRDSVLHGSGGRQTTDLLLVTIIWVGAHTASLAPLLRPSERSRVCKELKTVLLRLQRARDPDHWQLDDVYNSGEATSRSRRPPLVVDDVLTLILITIMISSGDSKIDSIVWWSKAVRLAQRIGLHQIDLPRPVSATLNTQTEGSAQGPHSCEDPRRVEERRRIFWLLYSLDRHLSLSFNGTPLIEDGQHFVFTPLPESIWNLVSYTDVDVHELPVRHQGPPTTVTGHGFFEYFLPLMTILGDIVLFRRQRYHPRLQALDQYSVSTEIDRMIHLCDQSVKDLSSVGSPELARSPHLSTPSVISTSQGAPVNDADRIKLVIAYAHFIVLVLQILLHGEWDALVMLDSHGTDYQHDRRSDWITSASFAECSTSTIKASEAISEILEIDPELSFMPYLFGIYLFHGSLLLLLFADRMTEVSGGPIQAVERACETVIRAHEACVVTLNTEFQRVFRRIMRTTLYVVRARDAELRALAQEQVEDYAMSNVGSPLLQRRLGVNSSAVSSMIALRQDLLELYRWNCGGSGLAV